MIPSLNSNQLDAFVAVVRSQSFSQAAKALFVTQSALSQRIKNLEGEMSTTLIIRDPTGLKLTEAGESLLRYCQMKEALESDFIGNFKGSKNETVSGSLRIAAFSSVMRSVIVPSLAPLLRKHPQLRTEFYVKEIGELPQVLTRAQADFIITDTPIDNGALTSHVIGQEKYVVITSPKMAPLKPGEKPLYLDNNPQDQVTEKFFRVQKGKAQPYRRSFFGDVYGILDGVAQGLGQAVMSQHLAIKHKGVRILKEFKPLPTDIYLYYYTQPYYAKLHGEVVRALMQNAAQLL